MSAAAKLRQQASELRKEMPANGVIPPISTKAQNLQTEIDTMKFDLNRREESYTQREMAYIAKIEELKRELENENQSVKERVSSTRTDLKFNSLKNLHSEIMSNLDMVKNASTSILADQERDLLRAFRSRLFDVQTELSRVKAKKEDGASVWITKAKQLEAEVNWATKAADDLAEKNVLMLGTIGELKEQLQLGDQDRKYLLEQLVTVKRENMSLGAEVEVIEKSVKELRDLKEKSIYYRPTPVLRQKGGILSNNNNEDGGVVGTPIKDLPELQAVQLSYEISRLKALTSIDRVKTLLVEQQSSLRKSRQNLATILADRTELQRFLKQCLLDIRNQIQFKENPSYLLDKSVKLAIGEYNASSSKSVELLKSQDRVVSLLYHRTFPIESTLLPKTWSKIGGNKASQPFTNYPNDTNDLLKSIEGLSIDESGNGNGSNIDYNASLPELSEGQTPHTDSLSNALHPISIQESTVEN